MTMPADSGAIFRSGRFDMRFVDERTARAAARDARAVGFLAEIDDDGPGGWLVAGRRRERFPADEMARYASRLRAIATVHGGTFDRYVED
jgi:hypothetical protein